MNAAETLSNLKSAKSEKINWLVIADSISRVQRENSWRNQYGSFQEWLNVLKEETGYSAGMLRRMEAAMRFLLHLNSMHEDLQVFKNGENFDNTFSLASVEILKRYYDLEPGNAVKMFSDVRDRNLTYRALKAKYDQLVHKNAGSEAFGQTSQVFSNNNNANGRLSFSLTRKTGKRDSLEFAKNAYEVIEDNILLLSKGAKNDVVSVFHQWYKLNYINPNALAVGREDFNITFVDGFDFRPSFVEMGKSGRNRLISELAFASTFFRKYWLVTRDRSKEVQQLGEMLLKLNILNVGIAVLDRDSPDQLNILHSISTRPIPSPVPDRRSTVLEEVFRQGVPDV